jgi:hypothetical protein
MCLGLPYAFSQNNIRGMYDVVVNPKFIFTNSWDGATTISLDREVLIHKKVNFIFPNFPLSWTDLSSGSTIPRWV